MKYSELHYERIDAKKWSRHIKHLVDKFSRAQTVDEELDIIMESDESSRQYQTYAAMASLNFSRNINDPLAKKEKDYYDSISPDMMEVRDNFDKAVNQAKFKDEISKRFGKMYFEQLEIALKTFDPKIKELLKEEINLKNEYTKLTAGAKINYQNKKYNLAGLGPFHSNQDRVIRKTSYEARFSWFSENSSVLDDIYDKLVHVRHKIAEKLGYDNFVELGYLRMGRTDYGPNEISDFRKQIVDHVVPVVSKLLDKKKKILNLDHLYFYDTINFKDGDPRPKGSPEVLVKEAQNMYRELSKETGEFFDIMVNEELMDLVNREGKRPGGFCTSFPLYERPYIFSNFNGTDHDITVLTHEAGHAFQYYSSRNQPLLSYLWPTMEAAEIHSMSMEFFTWPWMDKFFKQETERFKYKHMSGSLSFLPYGACVDHFQHWVYENPYETPKRRNEKWLELESLYLPNRNYGDLKFPSTGAIWQGQLHIYQMPFYYIDYTLAQVCAFQFWMKNEKNNKEAWEDYLSLCKAGGSLPFNKLVELGGLESPFNNGCLESIIKYIENWLNNIDISKI